ncbi:hypothetical protein [Caproiciproducens faecalis]|uniref:Ethanolamine utilization protein n=1 Tax=Caproiciproducens faecalis TaxID=2820301 RepID=A0ABS7DLU7_9FIRM|nr:hypothetical protein [Caproiciproducens faecalis]MBW7572276.1 hypothetical protein [Caproiciproducens faecalis]
MDIQGGNRTKPGLLILTQKHDHSTGCHRILESGRLAAQYRTECALKGEYGCSVDDFSVVILFNLTNDMLVRIAAGTEDTPYSKAAVQAILKGKTLFAVEEGVELFDYKRTAPAVYYNMMMEKVNFLKESGVIFCPLNRLEDSVLGEKTDTEPVEGPTEKQSLPPVRHEKPKREIVTARDLALLNNDNISAIRVAADSIISSEAWDYARVNGMQIIREK